MTNRPGHRVWSKEDLRLSKSDRQTFSTTPRLPIMVVLDGVKQAYNIGAIFRLCDAMLVRHLAVAGVEVDLRKRRLAQAACGTQFWTPWSQEQSAEEAVRRAKSAGYQIVVVELASNSVRPEEFAPKFPVCVVFGAEKLGIAQEIVNMADAVVEIPMRGMANSINVSTAAAIVLYDLSRRAEA